MTSSAQNSKQFLAQKGSSATPSYSFLGANTVGLWLSGTNQVSVSGQINPTSGVATRVVSITSSATITPTANTADQYEVTALATGATIAAPSGTPSDGQKIILRIKDNGTAQALTWTTTSGAYRSIGVGLPATTISSGILYVGCIYNSQDTYWDVVAVAQI
jgi:hypothetical protein